MFLQIKEHDLFFKAVSLCHTVQISSVQTDSIGDGPWQSSLHLPSWSTMHLHQMKRLSWKLLQGSLSIIFKSSEKYLLNKSVKIQENTFKFSDKKAHKNILHKNVKCH